MTEESGSRTLARRRQATEPDMRKYSVRNQGVELSLCIPQGNVRQLSEIEAEAVHSTLHVVQPEQYMSSKRFFFKPGRYFS